MGMINSIISRVFSKLSDYHSRYWEYIDYYNDDIIWDKSILIDARQRMTFQGNGYYIYKHIFKDKRFSEFNIYISFDIIDDLTETLKRRGLYDERIHIIKHESPEFRNVLSHAKYLVQDVSYTMDWIKKEEQIYVNTWHGVTIKGMGRRRLDDPLGVLNPQRNFLLADYLISPSDFALSQYLNDYMIHDIMPGNIINMGYPRNSVFFDLALRSKVRKEYAMDNYINIFYMPTWRAKKKDQSKDIERLAKELGDRYRVYVKFHPAMNEAKRDFKHCLPMPLEHETYEFLNAIDILITDYSSVFMDFACTGKPIVLYQYDKEEYLGTTGIYTEIMEKIDLPVAYDYESLHSIVTNGKFEKYNSFQRTFCPYDNAEAAKNVVDLLLSPKRQTRKNEAVDLYVIDFPTTDEELLKIHENINGNFRFVFISKHSNRHFENISCFDKIDYFVMYMYDRLSFYERIQYNLNWIIYRVLKTKSSYRVLEKYSRREQRRLWGDVTIGRIFAKKKNLPVAIKLFAEEWRQ